MCQSEYLGTYRWVPTSNLPFQRSAALGGPFFSQYSENSLILKVLVEWFSFLRIKLEVDYVCFSARDSVEQWTYGRSNFAADLGGYGSSCCVLQLNNWLLEFYDFMGNKVEWRFHFNLSSPMFFNILAGIRLPYLCSSWIGWPFAFRFSWVSERMGLEQHSFFFCLLHRSRRLCSV